MKFENSMSSGIRSFFLNLRKKRIIEILAAFIAGGWLIIEFVDRILVAHYHFPDKTIDITFVTLIAALSCTLLWRWFSGREAPRKFKLEAVLIPLVALIAILLDLNLFLHLKAPEPEAIPVSQWKNSIAVLPFVDMSPQKDQEYFCDGMTEELINRLSNIKELRVPARTSAFAFKGKADDIREIGRKLDVQTVLEGSIRKIGNELRVTAQLVNIANGFHLWSETYDRELKDVFSIQDGIALAITDKLKLTLLGEEKAKLAKRPTENLEAYRLYLLGLSFWNKRGEDNLNKSIGYFEKAVEIDPNYALAYAGLSDACAMLAENGFWPAEKAYPKAKIAVSKALDIDDKLAEAHTSLADIMANYDWNFAGAEKEFKLAIELNPGYATAHHFYADFLSNLSRQEEAISEIKIARNLDPLSPRISAHVGQYLFNARRYDQALEELNRALEVDPNHSATHEFLGLVYEAMGKYEDAVKCYLRAIELGGRFKDAEADLASCYALMGKRNEAKRILDNMLEYSKGNFVPPVDIALIFAALGEKDQVFAWLEKAFRERDPYLLGLSVERRFDSVRSDPRYAALIKRIGLNK